MPAALLGLPEAHILKYSAFMVPDGQKLESRRFKHNSGASLAIKSHEDNNTLVFIVDVKANKHQIKQAVKKLYDTEVAKDRMEMVGVGQMDNHQYYEGPLQKGV
ncbi:hypothetical protein GH733_008796 [Mirounga leonina]|nr:hypothetical protein GH733_008796 [Mirounga leonina]